MWSEAIPVLSFALAWLIAITLAFLFFNKSRVGTILDRFKHPLLFVVLVALFVRLVPILLLPVGAGFDIDSFRLVGEALLNRDEVYTSAAAGRHPYLPMQMFAIAAASYLDKITTIPFIVWIKAPGLLADVLITGAIFNAFRRWGENVETAVFWGLLYALNPIAVMVSAYHGQFDSVSALLLLLAWYAWQFGRHLKRSAAFLGFAILNKTWPGVLLPIVFIRLSTLRQRLIYILISVSVPIFFTALYVIGFASDPLPMLHRAFTHSGVPGYWGISLFIYLFGYVSNLFNPELYWSQALSVQRAMLILVGLFALWRTRMQSVLDALLSIILAIFAVTLGIGIQWLVWPVAFALLARERRWIKWYTITGAFMMFIHLFGYHMYPGLRELFGQTNANILLRISSLPVWITTVLWAVSRLKQVGNNTARTTIDCQ